MDDKRLYISEFERTFSFFFFKGVDYSKILQVLVKYVQGSAMFK